MFSEKSLRCGSFALQALCASSSCLTRAFAPAKPFRTFCAIPNLFILSGGLVGRPVGVL